MISLMATGGGVYSSPVGLQGSLFFEKPVNKYQQYKFSTGVSGTVLELDGLVGIDSSENILFVSDDFKVARGKMEFGVTVSTLDRKGKVISKFVRPGSYTLERPPKVSPDGSVIALYYEPAEIGEAALALLLKSGKLLYYYRDPRSKIRSFDWTPNGNLIIGEGNSIYKVDFNVSAKKQLIRTFRNGHIWDTLSVSPDGRMIAFSMSPDLKIRGKGHYNLYLINVDGTGLRLLADNKDDDIHGAAWSPDGGYLAVTRGIDVHDNVRPCRGALYIVKATATGLTLDEKNADVISLVDRHGDLFCSNPAETPIWTSW
ncbi:PD40 domain-containing protein [Motiliproteus sp. MSK22-1]|uniref:TolB family protein n=1 Tax=Motiliproteus sp. MSK22-1 TaxID=1897630 RepID=UPI001300D18E|nr:PD40 domain-containing protein [Motiliproteus sp. MSK22-1]